MDQNEVSRGSAGSPGVRRTLFLGGAFVLLLGIVRPVSLDPRLESGPEEDRFYIRKAHVVEPCEIVFLGDSRVLRGVSPSAVAQVAVGARISNFAWNSGSLNPEMYREVERRLESASPARAVVCGVTAMALLAWKATNEQYRENLEKPKDEVFAKLRFTPALRFFRPLTPTTVVSSLLGWPPDWTYEQEFYDDGWIASDRVPRDISVAPTLYAETLAGHQVSHEFVEGFLAQTREWTSRGIHVFAFSPPRHAGTREVEVRLTGFDEADLARRFEQAGGTWIDFDDEAYETYDGSHLTRESAIAFSRDLGAALREDLGGLLAEASAPPPAAVP